MDGVGHTYTLSANDDIFYGTFVLNLMLNLPIVQQWDGFEGSRYSAISGRACLPSKTAFCQKMKKTS
ncbi:MAG: hypothetical protein NT070_15115 [Cyanobacteria bacterium]|nr:hypothetical protein [Cyanobacteriota bacterium]